MGKHRLSPFEEPPEPRLRVHELAKDLGVTSRGLLSFFAREGISVRSASSFLDAEAEDLARSVAAAPASRSDEVVPGTSVGVGRMGRHARPSDPG
ncbi:translation initiation factor IF-2 N-terminal domain-containing protein [Glycomyces niveus]|uniref:Translation initiation factor IF-2 N-terminal domain-containing protein n=1 Tax=Glycomyces niveus TaxID=2820287 RepID=A0ABS3UB82_9ACTN|nr:translation initiation factor IF-2 N-terminal domain-containing protein [Glycomyces sp. NEAU-S30]